jgi:hypothetical protein
LQTNMKFFLLRSKVHGNDPLDQFIAIAKTIPEDARQTAAFIQGNISLLFGPEKSTKMDENLEQMRSNLVPELSRTRPPPAAPRPPPMTNGEKDSSTASDAETGSLFDDYDFVDGDAAAANFSDPDKSVLSSLGSKSANGANGEIGLPKVSDLKNVTLDRGDKQIFAFYSGQVTTHMECLSNAIDQFLTTIEQNQPAAAFVGESKFVILAAHKLVYIADSIQQCIKHPDVGRMLRQCSDSLCEVLKFSVAATKQAALQFPNIPSIQAMVDSMVSISHAAHRLKLLIQHMAGFQDV